MKNFYIIILILIFNVGYGQSGAGEATEQKTNNISLPTTANAYSLEKVGKLPIDLFKGKANINIPIYTIEADGVQLPISLSYNTGGIKLNEVASITGLGWALSIPNSITQNIVDQDDKYVPLYSKNINDINTHVKNIGGYDNDSRPVVEGIFNGNYDTRPDIFNYNLPTSNGSFIISGGIGYTIPQDDVKIEISSDVKKIKLKDKGGNIFYLTPKNISSYNNGESGQTTSNEPLFVLDSIRTVHGKKIEFIYGKTHMYVEKSINERANILITQKPVGTFEPSIPLPAYERYEGSSSNMEWLLTKIIFPEGEAVFQYSDDNSLNTVQGETFRKDLNSQNGVALRKILIKNKADLVIKDMSLNFSYFESNNPNKNYQDYRLKLTEVRDNLQNSGYSFTYNEDNPIPARNSNNDDYWGYINSLTSNETLSNIPSKVYTEYVNHEVSVSNSRNRDTNPSYSPLGTLNKIEYPTKGSKKLYYESNKIFQKKTNYQSNLTKNIARIVSSYPGDNIIDTTADIDTTLNIPESDFVGKDSIRVRLSFGNSCQNNNDDVSQIHETLCFGAAEHNGSVLGSNGKPRVFTSGVDFGYDKTKPIRITLNRVGNCRCTYSVDLLYGQYNSFNEEIPVGGLRIKKIEDISENNTVNAFNYDYQYFDPILNQERTSGSLNQPFQYTHLRRKYVRQINDAGEEVYSPYLEKHLVISNSGASYNSYASSDIVTYKQVTEYNDLGKTIHIFTQDTTNEKLYSHIHAKYNNWKDGLLEKRIILNKANDTVQIETSRYNFNRLKNPLSGYTPQSADEIGFAHDIEVTQYMVQMHPGPSPEYLESYYVEKKYIPIESGKIEKENTEAVDYLNGKKVITRTNYAYYDTDINKPMNLESTENILSSGEKVKTSYAYAHEKVNQLMIDKNMVGIPLETTTTQTTGSSTKTLSKTETVYPTSVPTTQAGNLLLPLSVKSYDLQNSATTYTEVTYDQYDSKGNLQQYTTKDGVPVAIVWGYNQTQPIAKVEGATYAQIISLASAIITASNTDASASINNDESALLTALDNFRQLPALLNAQVSTYTYDPLIGVRSITPPSGIREYYIYDAANRLEKVVDINNNILKEYKYNYKQ
ncbi:hypothetical protein [Chryseobacterium sp. CT-SW4]|uniref:hypothetical protein n=1 Tax=Chryseobacterium sp. SW-1 TaxID=3157343 RepID=UPI003B015129